jgi:hypothetical protein
MLSLILYGRNDSHGYNLHKRAAISLNAIAETLTNASDEVIFVDYNTPDELPTFLETIADTLTDRAKAYIRIIRVRPSFHRQFAGKTTLAALESQSRNIAIRRANPDNRWILSTNTDMIFVPQSESASLSSVCSSLGDGFYHLPRFELPEGFWERSDRRDSQAMIEALRRYGRRYHLNEVVYGDFDNVYEAPGDFQLFLRDDLFRIGGFDETMIRGWHVDTNMARRMKFLRGKVDTAFPHLFGYHCGHTRQATSLHGAQRTENSLEIYARNVKSAYWTLDPKTWGAPDEPFEELRLTEPRTPLFLGALDKAIPKEGPNWSEATYNEGTFCEEGFDAAHILPHLGDIVFNMPPSQMVFLVGSDIDLIKGFDHFVSQPPMNAQLAACAEDDSPGEDYNGRLMALDEGLSCADLVVIQFPNARTAPKDKRADLEWYAQHALERFIEIERKRNRPDRRRIVVINGIHSRLQDLIWDSLDAAAIPFSARLRQGSVVDQHWQQHPPADTTAGDRSVYKALGRARAFAESELRSLRKIFASTAAQSPEIPDWTRLAPEVAVIAGQADFISSKFGLTAEQAAGLGARANAEIENAAARCVDKPVSVAARPDIANRIASTADWEDEAWLALGLRYFGERAYTLTTRSRWLWERMALLYELERRVTQADRPWILVLADAPDPLAAMAAHRGYRIAYATTAKVIEREITPSWAEAFKISNIVLPGSLLPIDKAPAEARFAALISAGSSLFSPEPDRVGKVAIKIAARMMSKAHFGASSLVHLNSRSGGGALAWSEFRDAFLPNGVLQQAGLSDDAPVDARIPLDAAVRFAIDDRDSDMAAGLSFGFDQDALISIGMLWGRFPERAGIPEPGQSPTLLRSKLAPKNRAASEPVAAIRDPALRPGAIQPRLAPVRPATEATSKARQTARRRSMSETATLPPEVISRHRAFATGCRSAVLFYPAIYSSLRRNLLPAVESANVRERSLLHLSLSADADGMVRLAVPLAEFGPGACLVQLGFKGSHVGRTTASFHGEFETVVGKVSAELGIIVVKLHASHPVGDGLLVVELASETLEINLLAAACDIPSEQMVEG